MYLTVVVCTHNRASLLGRTLESLNYATLLPGDRIDILVVANACTDDTAELLRVYQRTANDQGKMPLHWVEEPALGKSHALNRAVSLLRSQMVVFVDDDHRVDRRFLEAIRHADVTYPAVTMFCGRVIPDWDGQEPRWVHDTGPYRVYPLPVPRFDLGETAAPITPKCSIPGGGNLVVRREVLGRVGGFSTALGPRGNDLSGSEDTDFILRALSMGEQMQYVPEVLQYHYVDAQRLRFGYLLRKSYQRSRSITRVRSAVSQTVPLYLWRKALTYLAAALFSLRWSRTRFYLIRLASTLGEMRGMREPIAAARLGADHDPNLPE